MISKYISRGGGTKCEISNFAPEHLPDLVCGAENFTAVSEKVSYVRHEIQQMSGNIGYCLAMTGWGTLWPGLDGVPPGQDRMGYSPA